MDKRLNTDKRGGRDIRYCIGFGACIVLTVILCLPGQATDRNSPGVEIIQPAIQLRVSEPFLYMPEELTFIWGEVVHLGASTVDGVYICDALVRKLSMTMPGERLVMCYTTNRGLQGMLELAVSQGDSVQLWGKLVTPPAEYIRQKYPVYEITRVRVIDPDKLN